jgi:hypothetical protein
MGSFTIAGTASVFSVLLAGSLAAQSTGGPPPYLQIFREQVKYGRAGSHVGSEAGWPRAFAKAKIKNNYVALTSTYGPNEAWFVSGHGSVGEIEAINKAIAAAPGLEAELDRLQQADAANVSGSDAILARFVADASNPGEVNLGQIRVWEVTIFRVRPGKQASFFEGAKLFQSVVQQAKVDAPWASFEVQAGMPGPTYLVFSPHKSLSEIDQNSGTGAAIGKAMNQDILKQFGALAEGFVSEQTIVFTVSPEMSYPMAEWVAQDPAFWNKKAVATAAPKPPAPKP